MWYFSEDSKPRTLIQALCKPIHPGKSVLLVSSSDLTNGPVCTVTSALKCVGRLAFAATSQFNGKSDFSKQVLLLRCKPAITVILRAIFFVHMKGKLTARKE